nr:AC5 protein [Tomato yellow leaf deformation dwarf virus]
MVVDHMIVHLPKTPHHSLLVTGILSTRNLRGEPVHDLETIAEIVLHSRSTGLVIVHVEHLAEVHRGTIRPPVPN